MFLSRRVAAWAGVVALVVATGGCHTMRFQITDTEPDGPPLVEERIHRFWGLGTPRSIDVRVRCPHGAVAVVEETSFGNAMTGFFTVGFLVPKTMTFYCRAGASS
jgi:hypothetical protein